MAEASTSKWVCRICRYVHEGEEPPETCPVCGASADEFDKVVDQESSTEVDAPPPPPPGEPAEYLSQWARPVDDFDRKYARIVELAKTGVSEIAAMRTQRTFPDWDTILFRGAQLYRPPLNEDEPASTETVIGKTAEQPLVLKIPFYVSHMSFGALSREAKIALAKGSKLVGTAMCSGEGGMLPQERYEAGAYIYEIGTAAFSYREEPIKMADAVEIKIGQAAKPGLGGHLPAGKVTEEIAEIRGIPLDTDSISPARPVGIENREDLKRRVDDIRALTRGKPVGIKISAGHVENDLEIALYAHPDFITIDCRGGATGAAPTFLKDNVCLPPIFALRRARRYLDSVDSAVTLCVTGGFRDSADIAKGLALGADAVALATASLIAIGCQQYRICQTGNCPVGITTQDPELRSRFDVDKSVQRFVNFYEATREELATIARSNGRDDVQSLNLTDVFTISHEVAGYTDIEHA